MEPKVSVAHLSEVPTTFLITLAARARGGLEFPRLEFRDPTAEKLIGRVDRDLRGFLEDKSSVYGILRRTQIFRDRAREFFTRHPRATGACLGCGLSDYFQWLDNGENTWVDFDLPESIAVRRGLLEERPRQRFVAGSLTAPDWWETAGLPTDAPVFLICEGVLMYLKPEEVAGILRVFGEKAAPGSTLIVDHMCWLAVGRAKSHPSVSKTDANFHWGPRRYDELTRPHRRLEIRAHHEVMESKGFPFSWMGPLFRAVTGVHFYAITELGAGPRDA